MFTAAPTAGVSAFAPAKLNLTLHVGPPGTDGFHPLASLAAFAEDVGDQLWTGASDALTLEVTGLFAAGLAEERDNLVLRAARALADQGGVRAQAALRLEKRLPIASGIGGGSADAAAALRALNQLWGLGASGADLRALAQQLGSDVPACVDSTPVLMAGRGDQLAPVSLAPLAAVLVNPLIEAPTGQVYRAFDGMGAPGGVAHPDMVMGATPAALLAFLAAQRNDLTMAAISVAPVIAQVIALLDGQAPGETVVRVSGSGATVAAYMADFTQAQAVARACARRRPDWWVAVTRVGSGLFRGRT